MWTCPVCFEYASEGEICACGYDPTTDVENHATLSPALNTEQHISLRSRRKVWEDKMFLLRMEPFEKRIAELEAGVAELMKASESAGRGNTSDSDSSETGQGNAYAGTQKQDTDDPVYVMCSGDNLRGFPFNQRSALCFWSGKVTHRTEVHTVNFHSGYQMESVPSGWWDVSEKKDRTVLAWMRGHDLHIASPGRIALNEDSSYLFCSFDNLSLIRFGSGVDTSRVTSMNSMFNGCESLTALDLSRFRTENVKDMSHMFEDCFSLTELDLTSFRTEKTVSMNGMFSQCRQLRRITFSNFRTESVEDMGGMFAGCVVLKELDLSHFRTDNVQDMSKMFLSCANLKKLNLKSFHTAKVQHMDEMFSRCSSLTELDLSGFQTTGGTSYKNMFCFTPSLKKVYINDVKLRLALNKR